MPPRVVSGIRRRFQRLSQSRGQVTHVLLTRSPLIRRASSPSPFDLHVLSTPPAFVLSQDQTLHRCLHTGTRKPREKKSVPSRTPKDECEMSERSSTHNQIKSKGIAGP